jgi:hypothetical protein
MAKVMEFFIYQNFRGNFYPENQKLFRISRNRMENSKKKAQMGLFLDCIWRKLCRQFFFFLFQLIRYRIKCMFK